MGGGKSAVPESHMRYLRREEHRISHKELRVYQQNRVCVAQNKM